MFLKLYSENPIHFLNEAHHVVGQIIKNFHYFSDNTLCEIYVKKDAKEIFDSHGIDCSLMKDYDSFITRKTKVLRSLMMIEIWGFDDPGLDKIPTHIECLWTAD